MTTEEILALVNAGYTAAEISAMQTQDTAPAAPEPADPEPADPEPAAPEPAAPEPDTMTRAEVTALIGSLQQSITDLTKAVQAGNARAARTPDPSGGKVTVESVVADFFGVSKEGKK